MNDTDQGWQVVKVWPGLRAEPKACWCYLWQERCRRKPDTVWVSYAELAADQGKSDRSARRWIETLVRTGLVAITEEAPNRVRLFVKEPREVCPDRPGRGSTELPLFDQPAQPPVLRPASNGAPADDMDSVRADGTALVQPATAEPPHIRRTSAAHPPAEPPHIRRGEVGNAGNGREPPPSPSSSHTHAGAPAHARFRSFGSLGSFGSDVNSYPLSLSESTERESSHSAQKGPNEDRELQALLQLEREARVRAVPRPDREEALVPAVDARRRAAQLAAILPANPETAAAVERLARSIRERVGDPDLRMAPCVRIARAILIGQEGANCRLPPEVLDAVMAWVRDTKRKKPGTVKWQAFVGCMRTKFLELGLEWPQREGPRPDT